MRLIEILLEILKEGRGNYISKEFFRDFQKNYRTSQEYKDASSKLKSLNPGDEDYENKRKEYSAELKEKMAKALVGVVMLKMFPDVDVSNMTSKYNEDIDVVFVSLKDVVESFIKISPEGEGQRKVYIIYPEKSRIEYKDENGESLFLWNPPEGDTQYKQYDKDTSIKSKIRHRREYEKNRGYYVPSGKSIKDLFRKPKGSSPKVMADDKTDYKTRINNMQEDIVDEIDDKILSNYGKANKLRGSIEKALSDMMEELVNYCLNKEYVDSKGNELYGIVSDNIIDKNLQIEKDGSPYKNKDGKTVQKVKLSIGSIYVETEIDTESFSINKYNTKIVIQGIQVLPMEG